MSDVVRLGEICRFEYGSNLPAGNRKAGLVSVYGSNGLVGSHDRPLSNGPTIVVGRKGSIGQIAYSAGPCWPIDTTYYIDETLTACDLEWLALLLRSLRLSDLNKASGVPGLNRDDAYSLMVEYPAASEQRRIAARLKAQLAAVEDARQAAQAQSMEMESLETAIIEAAFSENPGAVETRIGDIASVQSGFAFKSTDFKPTGLRLLRNTNVLPGRVYWDDTAFISPDLATEYERFALKYGDVLISLDRPIISSGIKVARVGTADLPALLVQRVGRFRVDEKRLDADFLYAYMRSQRFIQAISGHDQSLGVPHVSPGQVEEIEIPLPSMETQRDIVQRLTAQLDALKQMRQAIDNRLAEIERLPACLLAAAFNPCDEETSS